MTDTSFIDQKKEDEVDKFSIFKQMKAMIVEDDVQTAESLKNTIDKLFGDAFIRHDGEAALECFYDYKPDILFIDIMMPKMDGLELIREIRLIDKEVKVIIITAHSSLEYLQSAIPLKLEAYLVKPVGFDEFLKVMRTIADELYEKFPPSILLDNGAKINLQDKTTFFGEEINALTPYEYKLITLLLSHNNHYVSKETIDLHLYYGEVKSESALKGLINKLRHKIGKDAIHSQSGFGYKIVVL